MDNRHEKTSIAKAAVPDTVDEGLVVVFDTQEESEAMVVRGLLESFGIEALVSAFDAPQDVLPGVGGVVVRVRSEQAKEALEVIRKAHRAAGDATDVDDATGGAAPAIKPRS